MKYVVDYNVKKKYGGFIPTSLITYKMLANDDVYKDYGKRLDALMGDEIPIRRVIGGNVKQRGGGKLGTDYDLSKINSLLARFLIKKFTMQNDLILDPFLNRGEIGIVANVLKRHFKGIDISKLYVDFVNKRWDTLLKEKNEMIKPNYSFDASLGDATLMTGIKDNSIDDIITSPPYWYMEIYNDVPGELSHYKKYKDFLIEYEKFIKRAYEVMKPLDIGDYKHFFVIITGNVRGRKGFTIPFTNHTQRLAVKHGFKLWDEIIYVRKEMATVFTYKREEVMKRVKRVHETVSIFVKVDK